MVSKEQQGLRTAYEFVSGPDSVNDALSFKKATTSAAMMECSEPRPFHSDGPTPQINLSAFRFAATVIVSIVVLVGVLLVFVHGVVIDLDVRDELGSSKNVDAKVESYQVINGYVTAAMGMVMESYFTVFVVVAATFLGNVRWFPGDRHRSRGKRLLLAAFTPVVMFVLNVAISAVFVSHKTTGVVRVFLQEDLMASSAFSVSSLNSTTAANLTTMGNGVSVLDTILRGAVRQKVVPFMMDPDSRCVLVNASEAADAPALMSDLPSVKEVRSTAVVYGFPTLDWNLDALPFGLVPQHAIEFKLGEVNASTGASGLDERFTAFRTKSNVTWLTTYELLLQGKLLFERSISDANVSASYPCAWVDRKSELDGTSDGSTDGSGNGTNGGATISVPLAANRRRLMQTMRRSLQETTDEEAEAGMVEEKIGGEATGSDGGDDTYNPSDFFDVFEDGPYKNQRRCYGAVSSLGDLANITDPTMHTMETLINTMVDGFIATIPEIEPESMDLTIETYQVNPQIKLTAMTLDMPYLNDTKYRDTSEYCDGATLKPEIAAAVFDNSTTVEEKEEVRAHLCDQTYYPFVEPRATCGHANCVFLDKSRTIAFKKQLQLMPYLTNCSTAALQYSADYLNFFPSHGCVKHENAVFLYGLGSYMTGESFDSGLETQMPFLGKPRRHVKLTFAKLEWQLQDLSVKFQAQCGVNTTTAVSRCMGLLHDLENVTVPALNASQSKEKRMRVLVLGKDHLPADRMNKDYRNPVQLLSLNARPFYYKKDDAYYEWEYLNYKQKQYFPTSDWPEVVAKHGGLNSSLCSPLVDSYITQVEKNHLFMDDPRQPLYTAALFYLFQDAAVKNVKLTKNATTGVDVLELSVVGETSLKGDLETHEIKFSIPFLSLVSTFAGLSFLALLALLAIVCPTQRLKLSTDQCETENVAVQYAQLLQDDQYPSDVYERMFKLPTGERVPMDDFVVDSVTMHHVRDVDTKIYL